MVQQVGFEPTNPEGTRFNLVQDEGIAPTRPIKRPVLQTGSPTLTN